MQEGAKEAENEGSAADAMAVGLALFDDDVTPADDILPVMSTEAEASPVDLFADDTDIVVETRARSKAKSTTPTPSQPSKKATGRRKVAKGIASISAPIQEEPTSEVDDMDVPPPSPSPTEPGSQSNGVPVVSPVSPPAEGVPVPMVDPLDRPAALTRRQNRRVTVNGNGVDDEESFPQSLVATMSTAYSQNGDLDSSVAATPRRQIQPNGNVDNPAPPKKRGRPKKNPPESESKRVEEPREKTAKSSKKAAALMVTIPGTGNRVTRQRTAKEMNASPANEEAAIATVPASPQPEPIEGPKHESEMTVQVEKLEPAPLPEATTISSLPGDRPAVVNGDDAEEATTVGKGEHEDDVKYEEVGTPLTSLTSRQSVPSDDTLFVVGAGMKTVGDLEEEDADADYDPDVEMEVQPNSMY